MHGHPRPLRTAVRGPEVPPRKSRHRRRAPADWSGRTRRHRVRHALASARPVMAVAARALTLPAVVEELLSEMAAAARDGAPIPDEHLLSLKFVFGSSAVQALDLVDRQSVTLISSPSGRRVYQVHLIEMICQNCCQEVFTKAKLLNSGSLLGP
ncbi:zinc finger SWIM domain-containing protein 7 isoform X2 [Tursiops truncatus]|uniref:Zinc finger SWIM domain-containing protein 7 isoform X2 n=1 Tax=Tursiops truncatus TaxID=9739 RepID=A0A6J3QN95_TURTR|nr:zinc finger SWIM domain-containing protein 7 isoform X2 [Tursiops truncatus]